MPENFVIEPVLIPTFAKPALTASRAYLQSLGINLSRGQHLLPIPEFLWEDLDTQISDRAVCESDPSRQQLLPYVTLVDKSNRVFTYRRGGGGGESRLIGKRSVGLGGHVDTFPPVGVSLEDHLQAEAARELEEEVQVTGVSIRFVGLLSDQEPDGNRVPVGQVHLGIWGLAKVDTTSIGSLEEGIILDGKWCTIEELLSQKSEFENWSQICIDQIKAALFLK